MKIYSNPRTEATIEGWPSGRNRVTARFWVETTKQGQRLCRQTTGKAKKSTYASQYVIVDGDDGRTYGLYKSATFGFCGVLQGNMKTEEETRHPGREGYEDLAALFDMARTADNAEVGS